MGAKRKPGPVGAAGAAVASVGMAVVVAVGLVGFSGPEKEPGSNAPAPPPPPTGPPAAGDERSPFTGLPARPAPVLAVKIDNVRPARPHTGLGAADLVYVEQVEGGQSRILAVFSSRQPPTVGPVRSARESDVELLRQFGRPALAYSGSQSALKPLLRTAPLFALPPEAAPEAFFRDNDRVAPYNLYLRPERALAAASDADKSKDIGFRFGPAPEGGRDVNEHTVRFPAARFTFTWSDTGKRWLVAMDGTAARTTDGGPVGAPTVVVQNVEIRSSRFQDRLGAVSPYTETVGSGTALVLRDGKAHDARWKRAAPERGTSFTTNAGKQLNFAPGQVWVVLAPR